MLRVHSAVLETFTCFDANRQIKESGKNTFRTSISKKQTL